MLRKERKMNKTNDRIPWPIQYPASGPAIPWPVVLALYAGMLWLCYWFVGWWLMWLVSVGLTGALYLKGFQECLEAYESGMSWGIRFAQGRSWEQIKEEMNTRLGESGWKDQDLLLAWSALHNAMSKND